MKQFIGTKINNRFILKAIIGQGGMGCIFKALDLRKQEANNKNPFIAIKILNSEFVSDPNAFEQLEQEYTKTQILKHPNIVSVNDFDRDGKIAYITMELLEGNTLRELLNNRFKEGFPYAQAMKMISVLVDALDFAHDKDIIHRDFKPENIFITHDKDIRIIDFGISKKSTEAYHSSEFVGISLGYSSFEMYYNFPVDPRDDIYSLACVSYEILTGKHPFNFTKAPEARRLLLVPNVIPVLDSKQNEAILHALQWERNHRTNTVKQFYAELNQKHKINLVKNIIQYALFIIILCITITLVYLYSYNKNTEISEEFPSEIKLNKNSSEIENISVIKDRVKEIVAEPTFPPKPENNPPIEIEQQNKNSSPVIFYSGSKKIEKNETLIQCRKYSIDCNASLYNTEHYKKNSLPPFKLDQYELSVTLFADFIKKTGYKTDAEKRGYSYLWNGTNLDKAYGYTWKNPNGSESSYHTNPEFPVVNVSWRDATAYCRSQGGRLPSLEEWEYIARGIERRIYPWGNHWNATHSNYNSSSLKNVNSLPLGATPEGVYHLSGNVWEWTRTKAEEGYYLKGGSFLETNPVNLRAANSRPENETSSSVDDGFRCSYRVKYWPEGQ